ncbi:T6SS effector amidase Tae4 family protein [Aquabacterium sp.]|uniref:T6SS effector amidase Tae4 family protein n=1 Tax=Aquabacterium sp. TaxID=1872578 RepID=UPI0024872F53|nr:T6SS effector amidase Tae4 family protein [Aquabacterium sp.]MDI1259506.1 T6SS effector amidase Tae4 family protein [Aquabacterium sp.]
MRYFAEMAWYPTALLPSQGLRREAVDDRSANATRDPHRGAKCKVPTGFDNQCAIRVSSTLHHVGVTMKSFQGAAVKLDRQRDAIRAEEFAAWLNLAEAMRDMAQR